MSARKNENHSQRMYKLSPAEIDDPLLVMAELFDLTRLPQVRGILWDWLKATVTGSYPKTLGKNERTEIIMLYEKIEKLVEAAHVLHERKRHQKK